MKRTTRKRLRKLNRWIWNEGMEWLPFIVIIAVFVIWIAYALFESVRQWFS